MANDRKPLVPLFALWEMPSGKGWSGRLGDARVVAFRNDRKKNPKEPDLRVYVSENDRKREGGERAQAPSEDDTDDSKLPF